ncbi:MAG: NADPH-dependent 7-cyano-7-deazaguanine reductase QueF, partial [Waddliaceae bacterium]
MTLLGKKTTYPNQYSPNLLDSIPRKKGRDQLNIKNLNFKGVDVWNAYEISWLNAKGKPDRAVGRFTVPSHTPNIIESKSLKLYLNSLNQTAFPSFEHVKETLVSDLSHAVKETVHVDLFTLEEFEKMNIPTPSGICLDTLDISINEYSVNPMLLSCRTGTLKERLYTHLFKSNCLVTGQPDWATISIEYEGPAIDHDSLLRYLISFRDHMEF